MRSTTGGYLAHRLGAGAILLAGVTGLLPSPAAALDTQRVLHAFSGTDGSVPNGLMMDPGGVLYGTAGGGGSGGFAFGGGGVVFALVPNGSSFDFSVLYNFCTQGGDSCTDGREPIGQPLIEDVNGVLYGVTAEGGKFEGGTAFALVPNADRTQWTHVTLHDFCSQLQCTDGKQPQSGLTYKGAQSGALYDGHSPLFGTTFDGGTRHRRDRHPGTVYELISIEGSHLETVIHSGCSLKKCKDGSEPLGGVTIDAQGRLYGVVDGGHSGGLVYRMTFQSTDNTWDFHVLHYFTSCGGLGVSCSDGTIPFGTLAMHGSHLFGTTQVGGANGRGTVFDLSPRGGRHPPDTILYSFCSQPIACPDGELPEFGVSLDSQGNLFGVTQSGGNANFGGVAFEVNGSTETVLYQFCSVLSGSICLDGRRPSGNVIVTPSHHVLGTALFGGTGGTGGNGIVFELVPAA